MLSGSDQLVAAHATRQQSAGGALSAGGLSVGGGVFLTNAFTARGEIALIGAQLGVLTPGQPAMLVTLERHASSIDAEDGPRPYVYDITPHGLIARWRGSALAWPLLDATLIADAAGQSYLCALHRGDSFIMLDPAHPAQTRVQLYKWNGFGFSGFTDDVLTARCAEEFTDAAAN